jgi:hypothetical protein
MKIKNVKIRNEKWEIHDQEELKVPLLGLCDYEHKRISAPFDGDERHELDTIIHEVMHASLPDLNEDAIAESAETLANILWELNWRKNFDEIK